MSDAPRPPFELPTPRRSRLLDELGIVHGFFTREGGVSEGPFASLNTSLVVGDVAADVGENLRRIRTVLGVDEDALHTPTQVHGDRCLEVGKADAANATHREAADALVTRVAGRAIGVRTADCVPVLLACPETGWVAAVHAGWRGCEADVVGKAVERLRAGGATRIHAAIGPHISMAAFEVSDEVADRLLSAVPSPEIVRRGPGKPHVDLRRLVELELIRSGIERTRIDHVAGCTVLEPALYFSHRRDAGVTGRMLSAIVAPASPSR